MKHFIAVLTTKSAESTDAARITKNSRRIEAELNRQISLFNQRVVTLEIERDEAKDSLEEAKYPSTATVLDGKSFYQSIVDAQYKLDKLVDELEQLNKSLKYAQSLIAEYQAD